jgi:hypothetical protein
MDKRNLAVMADRKAIGEADTLAARLNYFPTPPWATRALVEEILWPNRLLPARRSEGVCWEPACGGGHMAIPLREYFERVYATDVHDWGHGIGGTDFLSLREGPFDTRWIITNPPFTLAEQFLDRALAIATHGVALLVRLQWLEGETRWQSIFCDRKPLIVAPFAERVSMIEGAWDPEASSATAYAWFIWQIAVRPRSTRLEHIEPGAEGRHTRTEDMVLALPGEAKRRKAAREAQGRDEEPVLL